MKWIFIALFFLHCSKSKNRKLSTAILLQQNVSRFLGNENFLRRPQEAIGSQKLTLKKSRKIMRNTQKIMWTDPFENILHY